MANFYEKLMSEGFYKEASSGVETGMSKDTIKELLDSSFSSEQMESLAEELGLMFEKEAAEEAVNLDDSIAKESAEEVAEEEAKKEASEEETEKEDDGEDKMAAMVQEMREKIASITTEFAKVSEFIESFEKEAAEDSKKEDGEEEDSKEDEKEDAKEEEDKKAEEATEEEISKEAAEEAMMIKEAYDQAAQYLAENDYTLADFVYSKVGDEHLALQIAEAAEKLAYVQDSNPLMEADVLISKIAEILE